MDPDVAAYIAAIPPDVRPLFDRIDGVVRSGFPTATLGLSYRMPTYRVGRRHLYVGVWKHGLSIYGWRQGGVDDVIASHPSLRTSKGTIQLRAGDLATITDDELRVLVGAALGS